MKINSVCVAQSFKQNQPSIDSSTDSNSSKMSTTKKTLLGISGAAILSPLIPLIDGDGRKEIKNIKSTHNYLKYSTGIAAALGLFSGAKILTNEWLKSDDKAQESQNKLIADTAIGATTFPIAIKAHNSSLLDKTKAIKGKWYAIASAVGAGIAVSSGYINRTFKIGKQTTNTKT